MVSPFSSLISFPSLSTCGTPAFLKYFETIMSVATCDHVEGISTSFISKTTEPSGLVILELLFSQTIPLYGSPGEVYFLVILSPVLFATVNSFCN